MLLTEVQITVYITNINHIYLFQLNFYPERVGIGNGVASIVVPTGHPCIFLFFIAAPYFFFSSAKPTIADYHEISDKRDGFCSQRLVSQITAWNTIFARMQKIARRRGYRGSWANRRWLPETHWPSSAQFASSPCIAAPCCILRDVIAHPRPSVTAEATPSAVLPPPPSIPLASRARCSSLLGSIRIRAPLYSSSSFLSLEKRTLVNQCFRRSILFHLNYIICAVVLRFLNLPSHLWRFRSQDACVFNSSPTGDAVRLNSTKYNGKYIDCCEFFWRVYRV